MGKATLRDVAEKAGVSIATVSYVLNGSKKSISESTRKKVMDAIEELDYVTNMNAKSLVMKDSKLIGVVIPQTEVASHQLFTNNFYSEILGAIEYKARINGYQIIISGMNMDENFIRIVHERNLDGAIAIGVIGDEFFRQFQKIDIPVVLVDSYCREASFGNIRIDDEEGTRLTTRYMIEHGHRKIGFMCGILKDNGVMQKRLDGYRKALAEAGIPFHKNFIYEGNVDFQSGLQLARDIVDTKSPVTGVVTTADIMAIGAIKGFTSKGKKVPEDYSVIGFDDIQLCDYVTPGLTTVKQMIEEKGDAAMEMLIRCMQGETEIKDIILPVKVVERESVKNIEVDQ